MSRQALLLCLLVCAPLTVSTACGGDDSADPLTCTSSTLCSYAEVTTYHTTIAAPAGGRVVDGRYRLAWVETERAEDDGRLEDLEALELRGDSFRSSGGPRGDLGTVSLDGTSLTLHTTSRCAISVADGDAEASWTYGYTASADELRLYDTGSSGGASWTIVRVYKRIVDPAEVCNLVSAPPSSPGPSAACFAANCFCAYAVDAELSDSSCPF